MPEGRWITVKGHAVYVLDTPSGTVVAKPTRRRPESPLKAMYRESKERDAARAKETKAATAYGIFPHAIERHETGRGYVVRPTNLDGEPHDARNYGGVRRVGKLYRSDKLAQRAADKLGDQ